MPGNDVDVLVAGAGPTGLVHALWLHRLGARVRIVDKVAEPGTTSRAIAVQARALELYRQIGIADEVVAAGQPFGAVNLWVDAQHKGRVQFGDLGKGLSPYPYALIFPQDAHEKLLIERLAAEGVTVERPVELVGLAPHEGGVTATLRDQDGTTSTCRAAYLSGCDGARSFVRQALELSFSGSTYEHVFYVADVDAHGPPAQGELAAVFDGGQFFVLFPLGPKQIRLIGMVPAELDTTPDWSQIDKRAIERSGLVIDKVHWFSSYRAHHRVATQFRSGRVFLCGDAAHIHSPLGGQGMNTGIGDAVNLAWKLAAVVGRRARPELLDTYEEERIPFAQELVATTDRAFRIVASTSIVATWLREHVTPWFLGFASRHDMAKRTLFQVISQTQIRYPDSSASDGTAGPVSGGDRLPWTGENYEPLRSMSWQVHVYGQPAPDLVSLCKAREIPLHTFPANERFKKDAYYLVRPDGHVGLAAENPEVLETYLDDWAIRA